MSAANEFSRVVKVDRIGAAPHAMDVEANEAERAALARRFALRDIDHLAARVNLSRTGDLVAAEGRLHARVTQSCVASGVPVPADLDEAFRILFAPAPASNTGEEEIELSESDCDTIFYEGASIDLGEAVAETLSLSLDPWPRAPDAEERLKQAGVKSEAEAGPFAALAALKDKMKK